MKHLQLIWKYRWAVGVTLIASALSFTLGFGYGGWALILGLLIFPCGFALPILVAEVAIREEEEAERAAEEAEAKSLEEVILELREAGLVQIHPSEEKTE
jgi:hypothetical protein